MRFGGSLLFQEQVCDDLPQPLVLVAQLAHFTRFCLAGQLMFVSPPVKRRLGDSETTTYLHGGSSISYLGQSS